jgi:hypothetical protein
MSSVIYRRSKRSLVDLQAEGRKAWKTFEEISEKITGFNEIKQSKYWYPLTGARDGAHLYTYFPFLFNDAFPGLTRRQMRKLSVMSLLYLYHMLLDDALMDEDKAPPRVVVLVSNAYSLTALGILEELFATRTLPWKRVMQLHSQYSTAALLEERHHTNTLEPYNRRDMLRILSGKSAMAKLILLSLCSLANRDEYLAPLMRSFDLHYVADQMVDDFRDWKIDLNAGRYSYLLTRVTTTCNLQKKIESTDAGERVELFGKHFYLSGIAESYFDEVLTYWDKAKQCVKSINCPQWVAFLNNCQMRIHGIRSEITCGSRRLLLQEQKYAYRLVPVSGEGSADETHLALSVSNPVASVASNVSGAARRAVKFLRKRYKPGIGFEEFVVFSTPLPIWVSAYVGTALMHWCENEAARTGSKYDSLKVMLRRLADDLVAVQGNGGWSPNADAPPDADTTAWVTGFLLAIGASSDQVVNRAVEGLLTYRRLDGGFCTYRSEALGQGFGAYGDSHVEVTAVALEVLLKTGVEISGEVTETATRLMREKQEANGLWQSYWWEGQMYATYHCLRTLQATGEVLDDIRRADLITSITDRQSKDGVWGEETPGKIIAFETALALRSLCLLDPELADSDPVKRGIVWLLNHQALDGSWDSRPMLRVPDGNDQSPWSPRDWKLDMANAVGVLVRDQTRSFTTATVLAALTDFLCCAGDRRLIASLKYAFQAVA